MVERRTANTKVSGSNPGSGTTKQIDRFTTWLDSVPNIQSKLIYHAVATHRDQQSRLNARKGIQTYACIDWANDQPTVYTGIDIADGKKQWQLEAKNSPYVWSGKAHAVESLRF